VGEEVVAVGSSTLRRQRRRCWVPATLHDVARAAGVSFKTVSNVINDYPHIRESTRQRVVVAIEALGYKPNYSARSLRLGRTGLIGLAVPDVSLPYFAALSSEVIAAAARRGLVVVIEQTGPDRSIDHVTMRNVEAARAATEYLIGLGHRRIAAIGAHPEDTMGPPGLRLRGYREALEAAGLEYDARRVGIAGPWHRGAGADAMRRVLAEGAEIDAVFAFNDTLALGAMHALQEAGLSIPSDVSVMGFDDIDEGEYSLPTLTTLDPGRQSIAELAVEALVDRISAPAAPARLIEVDFRIVARDSTRKHQ
jgi:DNA-binding LacI/PurR family transcriptional regulator